MRHPHGYIISSGGAPTVELDTASCAHCNRHYAVRPKEDPTDAGGWCGRCVAPICRRCAEQMAVTLTCRPFERWLEQQERTADARRRLDRALEKA